MTIELPLALMFRVGGRGEGGVGRGWGRVAAAGVAVAVRDHPRALLLRAGGGHAVSVLGSLSA